MGRLIRWGKHRKPGQMIVLGFATVILIGALLLSLPVASQSGKSIGLLSALFTSTTSVCVTGLIVVDTGTTFTMFGKLVIMLLIQVGGLGFMSFATMIFAILGKRISLRNTRLLSEAFNTDMRASVRQLAKSALLVTFCIELFCALVLSLRLVPLYGLGQGLFHAVFLAVSAFCNAGIDLFGNYQSLTGFVADPLICITIMVLIVLGGIGFAVILDVIKNRRFSKLRLHSRVVLLSSGILILFGALTFMLLEWNNPNSMGGLGGAQKVMAGTFQSVTARTAGFNTISQDGLTLPGKLITCLLMFIGASPASTGGGIKTSTFVLLVFTVVAIVKGKQDVTLGKRRISMDLVKRAMAIVLIMFSLIVLTTILLCILEADSGSAFSLENILLEVFSAFGTVGLSAGITPMLGTASRVLIILAMFIGRVGPLTLTIALSGKSDDNKMRYAEDRILIG